MPDDRRDAVRSALVACAGAGETVLYRDLAARAGIAPPQSIHRLTQTLEALIREDHAAGRPLLAALALGRGPDAIPGRGFFHLLHALGRYAGADRGAEAVAAHRIELAAALDFWGRKQKKS